MKYFGSIMMIKYVTLHSGRPHILNKIKQIIVSSLKPTMVSNVFVKHFDKILRGAFKFQESPGTFEQESIIKTNIH